MKATSMVINEHEMRILGGIGEDGAAVVATTFIVSGTDDLIPYYDGLAMLEVAKQDFIRRWGIHDDAE